MPDHGFTVPELVELVVSSALAGFLVGVLLVYLYLQHEKRKLRDRNYNDERKPIEGDLNEGDCVIDIRVIPTRQTPTIPIQSPPLEENSSPLNDDAAASAHAEAGSSHDGRFSDTPTPYSGSVASFPAAIGRPTLRVLSQTARPERSGRRGLSGYSRADGTGSPRDDRGPQSSTAELPLSRTTTNVSTLPAYDTLSSGPPRYSSPLRTPSSPSLEGEQRSPGFIPPVPDFSSWWAKQDGSDRF
ncbi:hypothetical protein AN958_11966 [Leucoagaricus sp. SymC.cos]|nr:hypothetical protein AN958_11966 [Leucoagaricus sp. SymC.cos]